MRLTRYLPVQNPGPSIICLEPDCNIAACTAKAHHVASNRINVVICVVPCALNDAESVLEVQGQQHARSNLKSYTYAVKVEGVLCEIRTVVVMIGGISKTYWTTK